jgi:hypothetical protein
MLLIDYLGSSFLRIFFAIQITFAFGYEMDWAGCPEFTVKVRIAAFEAIRTHINIVLQANIAGFPVGVI